MLIFNHEIINNSRYLQLNGVRKMKKTIILIVFAGLISSKLIAQNVGLGNTDPSVFSKFRIPETNLSSLWFNTNLNFNSSKGIQSSNVNDNSGQNSFNSSNSFSSNLQYSLAPNYYLLKQNDENWLSLTSNFNTNIGYKYNKNLTNDSTDILSKENSYDFTLHLNGSYGKYFTPGNLFYSISSIVDVEVNTDYSDNLQNGQYINRYTDVKNQHYNVSFGFGWGKIRDVTPVVSAIRFQERLKQLNMLSTDLSDKTIEDLSEQFSKSIYYSQVHDRADKFFWQDVEKSLANNGVSLTGINQYGSNYLREVLNEVRFMRSEGITSGINITMDYNSYFQSNSGFPVSEQFNILGNAYLNLSHQLNLNSQFKFNLSLSGGPNVIKKANNIQEYLIQSAIEYDYEITDRIVTTFSNAINYTIYNYSNASDQNKYFNNEFNISANYFIEDNLSLKISYQWYYNYSKGNSNIIDYDNNYSFSFSNKSSGIQNNIVVGFTYYINRGFLYN